MSLKDVTVICLSAFLDGLSTTSPTLLFNLYCLATEQRVQEKLYGEILNVLGDDPDVPITSQHIAKMPYLKAFVKETFRVWPNGTEVSRYTDKDMILSGYEIPAGTHVDLNPMVNFRNSEIFPDPDRYIPERWIRDACELDDYSDRSLLAKTVQSDEIENGKRNPLAPNIKTDAKKNEENFEKYSVAASKAHPFLITPFGHGTRMCAGRR